MNKIKELRSIGFKEVGEWLYNNEDGKAEFKLTEYEKEKAVYAFVIDSTIKYIGVASVGESNLNMRMNNYKNAHKRNKSGSTNKEVMMKIANALEEHKNVLIYALKPDNKCEYNGIEIDLVSGLENPLIYKFKPEWNE